jgi:hypothetical protein
LSIADLSPRLRVLVRVVDLVAAKPLADPGLRHALGIADRDALVLEGEIARRCGAGVEMLMEPHVRRHDHGADLPLVIARLVAFRPHQRIAFAGQDDHMGAGTVGVRLLVGTDRELRDVAVERALGEVEADVAAAGAAFLGCDQRQIDRVGNEIGGEHEALGFVLGGEIIRLAVEAALEVVLGAEDEIQVLVEIDDDRRVGYRDETRWVAARAVEVLVPAVQRNGEQGTGLPLEGDALAGVVPHRGGTPAAEDHDGFFEQLPLRAERLSGWNLADVAVVRGARGLVVHEHAAAAAPRPGLQLDGVQVLHIGRADEVEPFAGHPAGVGRLLFGGEFFREIVGNDGVFGHVISPDNRRGQCPHRRMFLYMERCSRIRASRYHPRSGARKPLSDRLAAETGREMPHGPPGDMSLPTVPKSRRGKSKNQ